MLDFSGFFAKARAGFAVNNHMEKSTVVYASVIELHDSAGLELVNFNAVYNATDKRVFPALGLRADNLITKLWSGPWGKAHVTTAALPAIEFGPYVAAWPLSDKGRIKVDWSYGVVLGVGFAK